MKTNFQPALPRSQFRRLARVRRALEIERRLPGEFHGKRLKCARHVISVPLGHRWRAIFVETSLGYQFRDCLTHESYNKINPATYLP